MKHLASLAVLAALAASQVALAEENPQQQPAKKQQAKHVVTHGPGGVQHNQQQFSRRINTQNFQHNPNLHVQSIHNTARVNSNVVNIHNKNVTNANALRYNANAATNARNWKGKQNLLAGNLRFQANHERWANYRNFERRRHDRMWWRNHYDRFALFGGGYYYWNNGFWYPAYGYDPGYTNYAYDAPIYAYNNEDPSQVIADVQNALSQAGYDPGPVDNTYGPATRDALMRYQTDNGLQPTGEIDEATLDSLGLQ